MPWSIWTAAFWLRLLWSYPQDDTAGSFGLSHVVWLLGQRKSSKSHLSLPISSAASLFLRKNHWFPSVSTVLEISWLQLKRYSEFQKSISKSNPAMQFFFFLGKDLSDITFVEIRTKPPLNYLFMLGKESSDWLDSFLFHILFDSFFFSPENKGLHKDPHIYSAGESTFAYWRRFSEGGLCWAGKGNREIMEVTQEGLSCVATCSLLLGHVQGTVEHLSGTKFLLLREADLTNRSQTSVVVHGINKVPYWLYNKVPYWWCMYRILKCILLN